MLKTPIKNPKNLSNPVCFSTISPKNLQFISNYSN